MSTAVHNLATAGIAVEAMCFTDFPTETRPEAQATLAWIRALRSEIALFICGRFGLSHGSRVAAEPDAFGIEAIWHLNGDNWQTGLFYRGSVGKRKPRTTGETIDRHLDDLSAGWWLHDYPWAGALSTAHSLLYYAALGPDVFRRLAGTRRKPALPKKKDLATGILRYPPHGGDGVPQRGRYLGPPHPPSVRRQPGALRPVRHCPADR